jgi:hypothetical protein
VDEVEGRGQALVLPEFAEALEALAADSETARQPATTVVNEIVLECPVVIEFVGEDISATATDAVTAGLLDGLAQVMRDA